MLEDAVKRFTWGRKIAKDIMKDYLHPEKSKYTEKIHNTRINGLERSKDYCGWIGYLSVVAQDVFIHPKAMYEIFILRK